jgi:hypothetical protein
MNPLGITRRSAVALLLVGLFAQWLTSGLADHAASARSDGSGGRAVVHRAGGRLIRASKLVKQSPDARLYRVGSSALEPTLGITRDGQIFYTAFQSNVRIEVMRSTNEGKTWKAASPSLGGANTHRLSFDPYLWVDQDTSRVFNIDLTVACSYLSFSDDAGENWTTNPLACGRPVNDHQTLFGGPPVSTTPIGYPNLIYYCWNDVATSSCSKSIDGGLTFAPTGAPAFPSAPLTEGGSLSFCGGLHGHGFVAPDGSVYLPKGHCGQPWLAISKDEGRTWTRVQVADNGSADHEAAVAADAKGNVYFAWIGRDRLPYLAVSRNGGRSWGNPLMIAPPRVTETNLPSIDVGGPGGVAIAYMGTDNARGRVGRRDYSSVTWNGYMTISDTALAKDPIFYSATVNEPSDPLIQGPCGPGRCQRCSTSSTS